MKEEQHRQMSESFAVGILLILAGGFQDAYTYIYRGGVFANAQTGNVVLLGKTSRKAPGARRFIILFQFSYL